MEIGKIYNGICNSIQPMASRVGQFMSKSIVPMSKNFFSRHPYATVAVVVGTVALAVIGLGYCSKPRSTDPRTTNGSRVPAGTPTRQTSRTDTGSNQGATQPAPTPPSRDGRPAISQTETRPPLRDVRAADPKIQKLQQQTGLGGKVPFRKPE